MLLVFANNPGIEILRSMQVLGYDDAPFWQMHICFAEGQAPHMALRGGGAADRG